MKVILTQEIAHLGSTGEIKEVANGYARNFLLPRGLARAATLGAVKVVERKKAAEERRIALLEEENKSLAELIAKQTLTITAKVGREGRLYGSVTAAQIAEALSAKIGHEIDRRKVELTENIHTTGSYEIAVKLVGKLAPKVTVKVVGEAEEQTAEQTDSAES
ncbi:50S ribosomal protein L9 [Candidatus Chlorohelix sp.]|uniref:50S ribosomal protein L9 n=1 Tax=Candidatus Chlorohelix sp. TaxID=3139201 RepID=UPI00304F088B